LVKNQNDYFQAQLKT